MLVSKSLQERKRRRKQNKLKLMNIIFIHLTCLRKKHGYSKYTGAG